MASLNAPVSDNLPHIFSSLELDLHYDGRIWHGPCPVHSDSDNRYALNIFFNEDGVAFWRCNTAHCNKEYSGCITGFIRGCLTQRNGKKVSLQQTINWIKKTLDIEHVETIELKPVDVLDTVQNLTPHTKVCIPKEKFFAKLRIPAYYYMNRGFSKDILIKYHIGQYCGSLGKYKYRAIVPILDDNEKNVVGWCGRSIFDECTKCKKYHSPNQQCPQYEVPKWQFNPGFDNINLIYNYSKSIQYIRETGIAIIVESPGNCLRLEECGIRGSLGIFGSFLKPGQLERLHRSGATTIIVIPDSDEAGTKLLEQFNEFDKLYRIFSLQPSKNDIADMTCDEVSQFIKPKIMEIEQNYGTKIQDW